MTDAAGTISIRLFAGLGPAGGAHAPNDRVSSRDGDLARPRPRGRG